MNWCLFFNKNFYILFLFKDLHATDLRNEFDNRIYSKINQLSQNLALSLADKIGKMKE